MDSILTVTDAADTQDLTILSTVKSELEITATTDDDFLGTLITESSVAIATYCNRVFGKETVSEQFRLTCRRDKLMLARVPVDTITSVTVDGTALESDGYEIDKTTGFLYRLSGDCRTCWTGSKIVVVYSAGFTLLTELPYDIERAAIDLVKRRYFARSRDASLRSVDVPDVIEEQYWGGQNAPTVGGLPEDIARSLDPYRNVSFG